MNLNRFVVCNVGKLLQRLTSNSIIFVNHGMSCNNGIPSKSRNYGIQGAKRFYSINNQSPPLPSEDIIIKIENGIRSITFNKPEKKNAMNFQMAMKIAQALIESNSDENTNIIVVSGTQNYFTSGMDLSGFTSPNKHESPPNQSSSSTSTSTLEKINNKRSGIPIFIKSFINCKKPLIALVNGPAIGFGVTMLGLFDTVYCSDQATFKTRFSEFGLTSEFCSTYTFPRIMGYAKSNNLLMFDTKMNAEEAYECGLVSRIYPHENFHEKTWKVIQELAQLPIKSLIYSKQLVRDDKVREFLHQIHQNEQDKFDPKIAKEVKRKFMEKMERKKYETSS